MYHFEEDFYTKNRLATKEVRYVIQYQAANSKLTVFDESLFPIEYVGYNSREAGFSVDHHCHDFYQLIFIIDGSITVRADKTYKCHKGDVIILPPHAEHSIRTPDGYQELLIVFSKCDNPDNQHYSLASSSDIYYSGVANLSSMAKDIIKWIDNYSLISANIIANYINLFMLLIANHKKNSLASHFSSRLSDYLDRNLERELSIDEISDALSISSSHLQRLCHHHFGMGVKSLFNKKRFAKACMLLADTSLSSKEIGEIIGFSTSANFSTFFKKHSGTTPINYRKNNIY